MINRCTFLSLSILLAGLLTACAGSNAPGTTTDAGSSLDTSVDTTTEPNPQDCVMENCGARLIQCLDDDGCKEAWNCMLGCDGETDCTFDCVSNVTLSVRMLLEPVIMCAEQFSCFEIVTPPPGAECGNGKCEDGETPENCSEDCNVVTAVDECLQENCEGSYNACVSDDDCAEVLECAYDCPPNDQTCLFGCGQGKGFGVLQTIGSLMQCGGQEGCFGGPDPEDPVNACLQDKCGPQFNSCISDEGCIAIGNCFDEKGDTPGGFEECLEEASPSDAQKMIAVIECGDANGCFDQTGPECGNGECEDGENNGNCPEDCETTGPGVDCLVDNCQIPDFCLTIPQCAEVVECIADCDDKACAEGCAQGLPGFLQGMVDDTISCAADNGCLSGGGPKAECGNGECEDGENPDNCPEDCKGPPPPTGDAFECILDNCNVSNQCLNSANCKEDVQCIADCQGKEACEDNCIDNAPGWLEDMLDDIAECAADNNCFGGGVPAECGNGKCEPGENPENCEEDCDGPPPPPSCGDGNCNQGENMVNCYEDCGPGSDACGNMSCDAGEKPENCPEDCKPDAASCKGKCGQFMGQGQPCHCDELCETFGNCCSDYYTLCVDEPPAKCGDDKCEGEENAENCPQDCKPAAKCGDDNCDEGETAENCPQDCTVVIPPECGNGVCEDGETEDSCKLDCGADNYACEKTNCNEAYKACAAKDGCLDVHSCLMACVGTPGCAQGCVSSGGAAATPAIALAQCSEANNCLK